MSTAPRPGWYRDPAGVDEHFRWWDGEEWTDAISTSAQAAAPALPWHSSAMFAPRARPRSGVQLLFTMTCGFAVFVAAGLGAGWAIWRDSSQSISPVPAAYATTSVPFAPGAPASIAAPAGQLDESTGVASIGRASMTLPGAPYELHRDPMQISGLFDVVFVANAEVHSNYDGSHSWSAATGFAHLDSSLTQSPDLEQAGAKALPQLAVHLFGGHPATLRNISSADRSVDGHPGMLFTAEVHYAIKKLPSTYDTISALVVRLDDGSLVVGLSAIPNDADPHLRRAAERSLHSLTIS